MTRRPPTGRLPVPVILGIAAMLLAAGAACALIAAASFAFRADPTGAGPAPAAASAPAAPKLVYDRQEFQELVTGKTQAQVLALVGTPNHVRTVGPLTGWFYELRTRNPAGGLDDLAGVMFGPDGRALGVEW